MLSDLLPFLHPLWQGVGIVLGVVALREGLALRRLRRQSTEAVVRPTKLQRHTRLGKACWWIVGSGYGLGIAELLWVRGEVVMRSAHFYFATLGLGLFCWGALYGLVMLHGTTSHGSRRELHAFLLPLALLVMVGAGLLGLALLP
jgi:hypothetical protein